MKTRPFLLCLFLPAVLTACLTKGSQTGAGVGLTPLANPAPGGMAGPEAAGVPASMADPAGGTAGAGGDAGTGEAKVEEGTFSDTPITVVGTPRGFSDKERPCDETGFTLCFSDVTISDAGPEGGTDRRQYRIEGCLLKKIEASGLFFDMVRHGILIEDLLFPELKLPSASTGKTDCWIQQPTVIAGRPSAAPRVRLEATYCKRTTVLDLPLPDPSSSPLHFDPCGSSEPTDFYSGGKEEDLWEAPRRPLKPEFLDISR